MILSPLFGNKGTASTYLPPTHMSICPFNHTLTHTICTEKFLLAKGTLMQALLLGTDIQFQHILLPLSQTRAAPDPRQATKSLSEDFWGWRCLSWARNCKLQSSRVEQGHAPLQCAVEKENIEASSNQERGSEAKDSGRLCWCSSQRHLCSSH